MRRLVLVGAGHSHALVLREFALAPPAGVEVTVVSPRALVPYSGMVPGWLAGHYAFDDIVVDFPRLCTAAGARWIEGEVGVLDPARRRLRLAHGDELPHDALSLNVGSTLRPPQASHALMLPLRPLAELRGRYDALLARLAGDASDSALIVSSVGGGAPAMPQTFRPQHRFLARLAIGDGRAIASRGPFGAEGRWAWRWKDRIDRGFLAQFHGLPHPLVSSAAAHPPAPPSTSPTGETA